MDLLPGNNPSNPSAPNRRAALVLIAFTWALQLDAIWSVSYVPLVDLPNHMARHYLESIRLAGGELPAGYGFQFRPLPNLGADMLVPFLMFVFPPMTACKVFLSLALLLYWVGPAWYLSEVCRDGDLPGRSSGLVAALFLLPWGLSNAFFWGFLNFYFGVGLAFVALAHRVRLDRREAVGSAWDGRLVHALLVSLVYLSHLSAWGIYLIVAACRVASGPASPFEKSSARWRSWPARVWRTALPVLPSAILFLTYIFGQTAISPSQTIRWGGILRKVGLAFTLFLTYDVRADLAALLLWMAVLLVTFRWTAARPLHAARGAVLALLVLCAVYVLLPDTLGSTSSADTRALPAMLVCAMALVATSVPLARPRLGIVLLAGCVVVHTGAIRVAWTDLDTRLTRLARAFDHIPPGSRLLAVVGPAPQTKRSPEHHFACWAVPLRGAFLPQLFAYPGQQPLTIVCPEGDLVAPELHAGGLSWTPVRRHFDYVWLLDHGGKAHAVPADFQCVLKEGPLTLWRVPPRPVAHSGKP